MRGRLSSLVIAFRSAPSRLPLLIIPSVLVGWAVGVVLLPAPQDLLIQWHSLLAAAGGLVASAGHFLNALSLRHTYPPFVVAGGVVCSLRARFACGGSRPGC
jgi:hypothetical protein